MNKKKLLALLMALVMTLSLVPVTAFAEEVLPAVTVTDYNANGYKGYVFTPGTSGYDTAYGNYLCNLVITFDRAIAANDVQLFSFGESGAMTPVRIKNAFEADADIKILGDVLSKIKVGGNWSEVTSVGAPYSTLASALSTGFPCGVVSYPASLEGANVTVKMVISDGSETLELAREEFTLSADAAIGNTYYATLAGAVTAANSSGNCTIKVLNEIDFSQGEYADYKWAGSTYNPIEITGDDVVLDLNGHTFSNMGNCALVFGHIHAADGQIANGTIQNGTLNAGKTKGVTNSYVLGIAGVNGMTIQNITTNGGINVFTGSKNVVIDSCNVTGTRYYTVCAQTGSDVTIRGTMYIKNTDNTVANKSMFWIQGADTDADCVTNENPTGAFGASSITLESGTFTVDTTNGGKFYLTGGIKPVVEGGTFNIDPSSYVATGYEAVNNGDGTWTVVSANANTAVAQIGTTKYATLEAAFAAVQDDETIELLQNIDLSNWQSIGTVGTINGSNGAPSGHTSFSGTLDGKNHTITGLTANLFNSLNGATIKDLTIDGATIHGGECVGALAGYAYNSTISNVTVTGTLDITGKHFVGGVVGYAAKTSMSNVDVTATGTISATDSTGEDGDDVGGVVGYFGPSATLANCDVNGSGQLTISADRQAGGLAGISSAAGTITNCSVRNVTVQCTTNDNTNTKKNTKIAFGGLVSSFNSSCGAITGCTVSGVTLKEAEDADTTNARMGIISAGRYINGETNALPNISATASNNTLEISSESELKSICDEVNRGVNYAQNTVTLTSDITLQSDIALNVTVNITKDLTIDLNDHNITATNVRALHIKSGDVTITGTGTISANGDSLSASSSVIRVGDGLKENDPKLAKASLTIDDYVTVSSNKCYGVSVFGVNYTGLELTVDGTINVTGENGAVANNGNSWNTATTITINGTVTAANDYAIYHPGKGNLTVNGTVTGKGGIEAKGGTVTIGQNAHVTATAQEQTHTAYNNGPSTSGYAIAAVENGGYQGDASVEINGGIITGHIVVESDSDATWTPTISITGGTFNIRPAEAYLAENYIAKENNNGTWTVQLRDVIEHTNPTWQWRVIGGEMKAVSTYTSPSGKTEIVITEPSFITESESVRTYGATDKYDNVAPEYKQTINYSVSLNGSYLGSVYKWGDICTLKDDGLRKWKIGGNVVADGTSTYTFAVTGDTVVTTEYTESAMQQPVVSATLKATSDTTAEFQAKWTIPAGATVTKVTIYRGFTSFEKDISFATLKAHGTAFNADLKVLNGDYLLKLTDLTTDKWQHAVIEIEYKIEDEVQPSLVSNVMRTQIKAN